MWVRVCVREGEMRDWGVLRKCRWGLQRGYGRGVEAGMGVRDAGVRGCAVASVVQ